MFRSNTISFTEQSKTLRECTIMVGAFQLLFNWFCSLNIFRSGFNALHIFPPEDKKPQTSEAASPRHCHFHFLTFSLSLSSLPFLSLSSITAAHLEIEIEVVVVWNRNREDFTFEGLRNAVQHNACFCTCCANCYSGAKGLWRENDYQLQLYCVQKGYS